MKTRHSMVETTIGDLTLVADGEQITGLYFPRHWHHPGAESFGAEIDLADDPLLSEATGQLNEYLAGQRSDFDLPLRASGDEFQRRVWDLLTEIPYGQTTMYGALAEILDAGAYEVGQAVGRNPLSVFIPCHRVVGKDGKLTGYAGGLKRKRFLLELEEPVASLFKIG